jgi:hypothetical protein
MQMNFKVQSVLRTKTVMIKTHKTIILRLLCTSAKLVVSLLDWLCFKLGCVWKYSEQTERKPQEEGEN